LAIDQLSVAFITGSLSRRAGGLFHSVRQLAKGLQEIDVRVGVFGLRDADSEEDLLEWHPIEPVLLNALPSVSVGFAFKLNAALREFKPNIIHQHGIWQGYSQTVSTWARTVPTVISPRGMLDPWAMENSKFKKKIAWHTWERRNLQGASCIHTLASNEAAAVREILPQANIKVIANAVEFPEQQRRTIHSGEKRKLLFLGRIHPKKGLSELVDQWSNLPDDIRATWSVIIAGPDEGGHRLNLEMKIASIGLESSFDFVGPVVGIEKDRLLRKANAFILPSHSEGLPMAILEAWSYGLPVLKVLANALRHSDLSSVGKKGLALVQQNFALPKIINAHFENYHSLLKTTTI